MKLLSLVIAAVERVTETQAYVVGTFLPAFVFLLGLIKCLTLLRRPAVNRVGIASLSFLLLGLFLVMLLAAVAMLQPPIKEAVALWSPVATLFITLTSLVLAVVALATNDRKIHRQGFAQAVWSLVLSLLFLSISAVSVLMNLVEHQVSQVNQLVNVDRSFWGYKTALSTSTWRAWQGSRNALSDFAAVRDKEAILVIPVDCVQTVPDAEVAAFALLKRIGITYSADEGWTSKPWRCPWGEGLEITGSQTVDGTEYTYILRVAIKGRYAQLRAGWAETKDGDLALVRTALDAISMFSPQQPPPTLPQDHRLDFGLVCNDLGLALYARNEYKQAATWFKVAFEQTKQDTAILSNVADALRQAGDSKAALEYLAPRLGNFPKNASLHLDHAWLLSETGDDDAAVKAFCLAVDTGLKDENQALEWLKHLNGKEAYGLSTQSAEKWMKKFPGVNSRRWHAETVSLGGDAKRGLQLLEDLLTEYPEDRRVLYDLGEALNEMDECARAADIAEKLLADGKESPRALMILGWSQMGRKWYRDAKETFERADKKQPDTDAVQDALRRASAMLGQGNNSDIKTPIEAVALPEVLSKALEAHPIEKDYGAGQPYVVLLAAKGYSIEAGKPMRRTWLRRFRIQTAEGASSLSSIEYGFDPLGERIYINRLEVRDETGKVIASKPGDAYVMDNSGSSATHRKKIHFQIPGLRPGCTVEYEVSMQDLSATSSFSFERHLFGDTAAEIVFVTGDLSKIRTSTAHTGPLVELKQKNILAWMGFNQPYDRNEPMSGYYEDRVPCVFIADAEGSWEKIGADFLKDIADRLKPDPKAVELAATLTAGLKTGPEKIAALASHVQKQISYTAIEFGTRARRPNPASQTLQQQYGDCKDQALLMHQLLQAAGIESHLALVNSTWRIQPSLPTMDQFNHMVVHVPSLGAGWLIDTTNKSLPPVLWRADNLWHSHALILHPGHVNLQAPQAGPAAGSALVESRRVVHPEDDGWHVEETLTIHGYYGSWMRDSFAGLDVPEQLRKAQSMLGTHARVHACSFANLEDISQPAAITLSYDVPGRLRSEGGQQRATLPALWETEYLVTTFVKNRQNPFVVQYPLGLRSQMLVEKIHDAAPAALQSMNTSGTGTFTHWKLSTSQEKAGLSVHFEFDSHPGEHPASEYAKWHNEWNSAHQAWEHPLIWKP
ncbi:DUF3857 domain-containing protein [Prosthecobacter sp.]|uniref:DUF3857 domain-containing protein n=1 Tax=Prosthecobacter sp. TaxID=1965333 RepID=UPI0037832B6C